MPLKDVFLTLLVVIIWGVNFSFIKIGLEELPPFLFSAARFAIVALPAVFFIPFPKTSVWNVLGVGLFLGILKFGLLFLAMREDASAGLSSLILQAQVLFTIALSVVFLKERISFNQAIGIFVAAMGFSLFFTLASGNITFLGLILILAAALFWGFSNLIMKRVQGVNLLHFMIWVSLVPPLPLLLVSIATETNQPWELLTQVSVTTWGALAYVSYLSTLFAFALWGYLLKTYPAASVTPFALLIPVVGMLTSALMLGESLTTTELLAAGLIMLGLVFCVFNKALFWQLKGKVLQTMSK